MGEKVWLKPFCLLNCNMRYFLIILSLVSFGISEQSKSDSYDILILINGDRYVGEYLSELNQEKNIAFKPKDSKYPQYVDLNVIKSLILSNGHYVSIEQLNKIQNLEFEVEDLKKQLNISISNRKTGGFLIALGSSLLLIGTARECDDDCITDPSEIEKFADTSKIISIIGYACIAVGGLFISSSDALE